MLRQGITALGDAYLHPSLAPVYDRVRLPITVRPFCGSTEGLFAPPSACLAAPAAAGGDTADAGLLPAGIKIFADGGGNTTATSLASGRPPRFLFYRQDALDALVGRAHAAGLPVAIHAAGDIAVSMALDAIERARLAYPAIEPRFRIEHAITIRRPDIPRLRALEVAVVTQPEAVYHAGDALSAAALAPDVLIAPFRALLDSGVMLAFSSDSPCYALSPLWQIWCAVSRATASGATLDDGQSVTMEEALVAYTRAGAAAIFTKQAGQLSPGRRADMLLLPIDPRALSPDRLRDLRIEQTWCAGQLVSESADEQEQPPGRPVPLP